MQKNVYIPLLVLAIAATGIILLFSNTDGETADDTSDTIVMPDVSTDKVWNAYTLDDTPFIYPADWKFEELKDGFKVTYPVSSNSFDNIEAGGKCPEVAIPEIHNACINDVWLHTQSENGVVLGVFDDMKKFGENEQANIKTL